MKAHRLILTFSLLMTIAAMVSVGPSEYTGPAAVQAAPFSGSSIVRVYFDDLDTARRIATWIEPLESKYEKGYLVLEVSTEQYDLLIQAGLQVEADETRMAQMAAALEAVQPGVLAIPGYSCYRTVEETFATAASIAVNYPDLATWSDGGDSWEKTSSPGGYDMMILRLTNSAITGPKPRIFMTSAIHAREYTTAELITRLAEYLVDNYGTDADTTWLLDHHEIHMMLHTNPDGRKQAETGLSWRKNTNQNYCGATSNNRGADLNRNFQFEWNCCGGSSSSQCSSTYHGSGPASEPETQAVQDYIFSLFPDQRGADINEPAPDDATGIYLDIHSSGRLLLWPWGFTSDPAPNGTQLQTLGRKLAFFNYHTPQQSIGLYPTDGTTTSFAYGEMGLAAFTYELGTEFFESCSYFENTIVPDNMPSLLYAIKVARTPYLTPSGPDALDPALSQGATPPGVATGTAVTLSATINDTRYNNTNGTEPTQNIAAAEYYVDVPPWVDDPSPIPVSMTAADGSFNSTVESVTAAIDTTGLSDGQHTIFIRGRDSAGNWGAFSAIFLYIENRPCSFDSDCDDGVFCNGAETCGADSFCQSGSDPCPGESCDEVNDVCVAGPVFEDDFESGNAQGWDLYGAGSTASTGNWEMGDPNGTISGSDQAQTENAYEGSGCAFTAQNSSLGSNDVDSGVVYLVSPVIDLSGADSADLEFVRWFYNRDTGEDAGDFFVAEVSDDSGATWVNLETLDTNQSANTWTERSFSLENYIDLTSTVRVRFGAADGSSAGNIIEAAIDNVKVWAYGGCEQDSDCDDGLYCNGVESCDGGVCQAGSDPCPDSVCDENSDGCVECLIDGDCDDGLFCTGAETCDGGSCQAGTAVECNDGIACTVDSCNEGSDACDNIPVDGNCDDGSFCNGSETCDAGLGCQDGSVPCVGQFCDEGNDTCYECESDANCDDGQYCNGAETCVGGACQAGSDPCPAGQYCNEDTDDCETVECLGDEHCDDGNACTVDTCVGGVCQNDCESTVALYPYTENFESGWGDWLNESGDDIDWNRNSGSTPSSSTGPSGARGGAYYIYTEASSPNYPDRTALLVGPCFDLSDTIDAELTFWYHMYGSNMGSLNVEVSEDCATWTNVWSLSGDQGNTWYEANVDLSLYSGKTITIRFRGVTGSSYTSDMAIDDVAVTVTPAVTCTGDSDCDDGVFCNGAEVCVDNLCQAGSDPCPGESCDEENDVCVAGPVFEDDFESGNAQGWDLYGADSTASTGNWEMGDPNGTISGSDQAQPEDAYEGSGCAFTAQNSSLGSNDVDSGVVYLVSPVIDLSGADSADLEFVRWFYNRDTGEDAGDFFVAEVSDDSGATWVNLETLDTNQSANSWTERSFSLENHIDLTSTVRVRFGAADGSSAGNIIEAAIDNVKVWAYGGCEQDSDCDDGLFCNGVESCAGGVCQAGPDPCPGQLCDEDGDQCMSGPSAQLEAGTVMIGPTAVTVFLSNTYISPVVVCSVQYSNNSAPVVPRVFNVTVDSFDVYLQNPSGDSVSAEKVSYLVMEEGVWTIDGVNVEAQKYLSTVTDENNGWVGSAQVYGQSYTNPVVIGQVMSANDPDWSVFWCQGSSRSTPPSSSALITGKTVCEDTDTARNDETVGFIVFETGHGTLGGVEFEALVGADTVKGVTDSPPYAYTFNTLFASAPTVAVTTMAGVDGGNGGWSYSHGPAPATATTLNLSIDEDQVGDSERNHTTEQVGYVAFETPVVYPPAP